MKKRSQAALCALLFLLSCLLALPAAAASKERVYFMVVNETVLELRGDTMPFLSGGTVYVPYTMFDPDATSVNLGVFASYSNRTVMVYSRTAGALIFDLSADTVTTSTGEVYSKTAITRNSIVFLPVRLVCEHFGLRYSLLVDPEYGYILRVTSSTAVRSDADFVEAARSIMTPRYNAYVRSLAPAEPGGPATSPNTPTRPEGGSVYLAFRCDGGGGTEAISAALERQGASCLFFYRPEDLAERDDEIRALAAAGHRIGLILDGGSDSALSEQAAYGNRLLSHILRMQTSLVLLDGAAEAPEGQFAWSTTVDGLAGERSSTQQVRDILRESVGKQGCFLLMDDSERTGEVLERVLEGLEEEDCELLLTVETAFLA